MGIVAVVPRARDLVLLGVRCWAVREERVEGTNPKAFWTGCDPLLGYVAIDAYGHMLSISALYRGNASGPPRPGFAGSVFGM